MKLFIWTETVDTGAYHEDGSLGVIARDLEQAKELVAIYDGVKKYSAFRYLSAFSNPPDQTVAVGRNERPRVLFAEGGCDC